MRHFKIKRGQRPSHEGAPAQSNIEKISPESVAFLGSDFLGLRPVFEVSEGHHVAAGQTLFRDRRHPDVKYVSPMAGRVSTLSYGARRTLSACVVTADATVKSDYAPRTSDASDASSIRETLLGCGFWSAFRTRPFGRTPEPDAIPVAIFVNACQASPLAPDPRLVLRGREEAFQRGISVLTQLTEGKVFVCQSPGEPICPEAGRIEIACFSGTNAAGLAGTHIDRLCPVRADTVVWTIGYQDLIAIGNLFHSGSYSGKRVVSVAGPGAAPPRLVETYLGAKIADICSADESPNAVSGDVIFGHSAAYLRRFDEQISVHALERKPHIRKSFRARRLMPPALIPTDALDRTLAPDVLAVPLLRALSIGDSETAARLGCLALIEEDVAPLSRLCTSGTNYGALLRLVLDDLMAEST